MNHLFKIAEIGAAHGVRGEVKLICFLEKADDIGRYLPLTNEAGTSVSFKVTGHLKGQLIVKFDHVADRNEAERLRGAALYADSGKRPDTADNTYYLDELIGLPARLADGTQVGTIAAIENYGAGDILQIKRNDGEELLLPFKSPYIVEVTDHAVMISVPEYLGESEKEDE